MIGDLNRLIKPRLHIMDGVLAMEGNGPQSGNPIWMNKILEQDVKGANTWLAISMGQMLGPQLAPHTTVKVLYRPDQKDYQVTAWVRVLPREGRR